MNGFLLNTLFSLLLLFAVSDALSAPDKLGICITCHGVDGRGNEAVGAPKIAGMEDWHIRDQLLGFQKQYRGTHASDGYGKEMKAMADFLTESEIEELIKWIGKWPTDTTPATVAGDSGNGQVLYAACAICHGTNGQGNAALKSPALAGQNDWYLLRQLHNFKSSRRGTHPNDGYGQQMQSMMNSLPDGEAMRDVVAFIQSLPIPD
jgi:cytochrome c553